MGEIVSFWVKKSSTVFYSCYILFKSIPQCPGVITMHGEMVVGIFCYD